MDSVIWVREGHNAVFSVKAGSRGGGGRRGREHLHQRSTLLEILLTQPQNQINLIWCKQGLNGQDLGRTLFPLFIYS